MPFGGWPGKGEQAQPPAPDPVPGRLVAAAPAAATATASIRGAAGGFSGNAVARPIRRAEHRELNRVAFPRALRTSNLLRLVQHNLLKVRLAILADVFVDRHRLLASINSWTKIVPSGDQTTPFPRHALGSLALRFKATRTLGNRNRVAHYSTEATRCGRLP